MPVRQLDHIDAIRVNENSTSYNRLYGKAVNNSESFGDIDINIKQRVERGLVNGYRHFIAIVVYVGSLTIFLVKEIWENRKERIKRILTI